MNADADRTIDEAARRRFEASWSGPGPAGIEPHLPPPADPRYAAVLEELVLLDLELGWKLVASGGVPPPPVEDYVARFPDLADPATVRRLARGEFAVRHRYGDRPQPSEYRGRFAGVGLPPLALPETLPHAPSPDTRRDSPDTWPDGPRKAAAFPPLPGYEILGELGRGGMGVVYRARDTRLGRTVALKMIRDYGDVGEEDRRRFRLEAESVARMQHPNVVQIFEVGEADGQMYCALEYVPGGTLAAAIAAAPFPAADATRLVETLARAVHHAHQNGIVHRDLKPGNVLLTADGTPKVADFGLAKLIDDGGAGRTRSGAVLGTPMYMAPEQAAGDTHRVGPTADVYSLGAILYELLAGRAPFKGGSAVDVMHRVIHEDPVPPSRFRPGVGRDVETVCLKCLEKDPARRYTSALLLAQDLERARAGEPILARREGPVRRAWRKLRKRRAVAGLGLALLATLAVAGWLVVASGTDRRVADLERELEAGVTAPDWPAGHADHLEGVADELARIDPARGDAARRKVRDGLARNLRAALARPRITADDVPALEADLGWLRARDAEFADRLGVELRNRLRASQPAFDLAPPFAGLAGVFPAGQVEVGGGALVARGRPDRPALVRTLVRSAGPVRVEVEYDPGWGEATRLGVGIDVPPANGAAPAGYTFAVAAVRGVAPGDAPAPGGKPAEARFRDTGRHAELQILRAGVVLRRRPIDLVPGPLRVAADRDGDRLSLQVNEGEPLTFSDVVPLPTPPDGSFAVLWPPGVPVNRVRASAVPLPPAPSALERADELFVRGRYADALPLYEQQAARAAEAWAAEARCKAGLCLVELRRPADAVRAFESVVGGADDRWAVVAAAHLWKLLLAQKRYTEAEATFASLRLRLGREQLALYVPDGTRAELTQLAGLPPMSYIVRDKETARRAESLLNVSRLLRDPGDQLLSQLGLIVGYTQLGEVDRARQLAADQLAQVSDPALATREMVGLPWLARWYGWLMQTSGRAREGAEALERVRARTAAELDRHGEEWSRARVQTLRVPIARLLAAGGDMTGAEAHVDAFLSGPFAPADHLYVFAAEAWLIKGFLLTRRGDEAGAVAAWKRATVRDYDARTPGGVGSALPTWGGRYTLLVCMLAGSLSGDLSDPDATEMWRAAAAGMGDDPLVAQLVGTVPVEPAVVREMWRSARGREAARRLVFLDTSLAEFFRTPLRMLVYEKMRQDLFERAGTEGQEAVLWDAVTRLGDLFFQGGLGKTQVFQAALAWGGTTGGLGWGGLAPKLPPEVRGPLAYLIGVRLGRLGKPTEAKVLFRTAAADAPPGSVLAGLAKAEIERPGGK